MANQLKAVVTAEVRQFVRSMDTVGVSAANASAVAIAAFAAVAHAVVALDKAAINAAKSYETLRIRLQLLSGDMQKGAKEFQALKEFAENSAFATDEVISAYIRLRAVAGQEFATRNIENIAFAAKVAGTSVENMAARVGELVLRIRTGLTGGLLARSLRTFGTAFGEEATLQLVRMAQAGEQADVILGRVQTALNRLGGQAQVEFANSIEGLEKQLGGLRTRALAELGEDSMETYKDTLKELNSILANLSSTNAFKELGNSLAFMNKELAKVVEGDNFKQWLLDIMLITSVIARALAALIKSLRFIGGLNITEVLANPASAVGAKISRDLFGTGTVNQDVARLNAGVSNDLLKSMKKTSENTGVSANVLDPDRAVSGDR